MEILRPILGLKSRKDVEFWGDVHRYKSGALLPFIAVKEPPPGAAVKGTPAMAGDFALGVGREVLDPVDGAETVAKYADGGVAAIRHSYGKGAAWVVGFYAGLEYSADVLKTNFNTAVDFRADKRAAVAAPVRQAGVKPFVEPSQPVVEGVLLKNRNTGRLAVSLVNWGYSGGTLVPQENVRIVVRSGKMPSKVISAESGHELKVEPAADGFAVVLPHLAEGDVLLLQP